MAIAVTSKLVNGTPSAATTQTTASFTPTANALIVIGFAVQDQSGGVTVNSVTDTGNGLTWSAINSIQYRASTTFAKLYLYAAQAPASPNSMVINMNCSGAFWACWSVFEVTGSDVANGVAQTFVQSVTGGGQPTFNAVTNISLTQAAAGNANNRPFLITPELFSDVISPRTNWTEINQVNLNVTKNQSIESQWRSDTFETAATSSWSTGTNAQGIAFEIKAGAAVAAAGGGTMLMMGA